MKNDSYKRLLTDIVNADLYNAIENYNLDPCGYFDGETCSSCPSPDIDLPECHKAMLIEIKFRIECFEKQKERRLIEINAQDYKQLILTDAKELQLLYSQAFRDGLKSAESFSDEEPESIVISGWKCNEEILSAL